MSGGRLGSGVYVLSFALHAGLLVLLWRMPARVRGSDRVNVDITETTRPKPAPILPKAEPPRPKVLRKLAALPPPPKLQLPPPPNQPPPPAPTRAPVRIGISMASSSPGGTFAAPIGNSLYGKPPDTAPDPGDVHPYSSPKYAALTVVTAMPEPIETSVPKNEYPQEALRDGFEGDVVLSLYVDETGRVRRAKVIKEAGHGLGEAAVRIALKYFRFKPAQKGDERMATEIPFTLHFELP